MTEGEKEKAGIDTSDTDVSVPTTRTPVIVRAPRTRADELDIERLRERGFDPQIASEDKTE
ncbi:hypothetical protein K2P56_03655 [Patescibacteria group bacterium]|nr:hypothetical protein [Patescibacteria group bacterium]